MVKSVALQILCPLSFSPMKVQPHVCQAESSTAAISVFFVTGGTLLIALVIIHAATSWGTSLFGVNTVSSPIALGVAGLILLLAGIGGCMQKGMPLEIGRD